MFNPVSTYRIQFHKDFTFSHLERIIPYLAQLGIGTLYASPIFKSTPGSTHGYDGVDPLQINPEIGTLEQLRNISKALREHNISWLQDIVPNHMAFHPDNAWLMDVLEKGDRSLYRNYFDLPAADGFYTGPVMVPFLGDDLQKVIDNGELKVVYDNGRFAFNYFDTLWPLQIESYQTLFNTSRKPAQQGLINWLGQIEQVNTAAEPHEFSAEMDELKQQLAGLMLDAGCKKWITSRLSKINTDKTLLATISQQQHYRLCCWQETDRQINYRRFFTVNGLICLNIQHPAVFEHYHTFIKQLVREGIFQGLRIDHIDGLYDPAQYLERLRHLMGDEVYIVAEKILEEGEQLEASWPLQGNSGYDFLAIVNNLLTNEGSQEKLGTFYKELSGNYLPVTQQIEQKKRHILNHHMAGELQNLLRLLKEVKIARQKSISDDELAQAIAAFLIKCPVYRYYGNMLPLKGDEKRAIKALLTKVGDEMPQLKSAVEVLRQVFLKNTGEPEKALAFYQRCMQFTGPLMAKGVEDTLMYINNRFIAHNEVGDNPAAEGITADTFHQMMKERQKQWPLSINGTSTHDTKRGEDVRARLNVISDLPDEWLALVAQWQKQNRKQKTAGLPDVNDEYFIYQTLLGAFPMPGQDPDNFATRIQEYLEKTLREGKQHSDWAKPNLEYEQAAKDFAVGLLSPSKPFWKSFQKFHQKVAGYGAVNSLTQVLLKFTSPGVPDVYQGCEHWDFSLVDPDNRRPVDYDLRADILNEVNGTDAASLWKNPFNGRIKLWLVKQLMDVRRQDKLAFSEGSYVPLKVTGPYAEHIIAFARHYKRTWYTTVATLNIAVLCEAQNVAVTGIDWQDTLVELPVGSPENFTNLLTAATGTAKNGIYVKDVLNEIPVALLKTEHPANGRGAGVLMHITSLPSAYGIGDMGPSARRFADTLHNSYQKYWQLLPLGPIEEGAGYSPYSSYSSMAGNELLISPELLAADGLLSESQLHLQTLPSAQKVDYAAAQQLKNQLFNQAWTNFKEGKASWLKPWFDDFCARESYWLDDFALYTVLKAHHQNAAWNKWGTAYRDGKPSALKKFSSEHRNEIDMTRWLQFIFARQWQDLKSYCNNLDIQLFGDLPFYVSYDSADVWSHREIFSLDDKGNMQLMAGVPPDYFNGSGQLWGMPVFNWDKLKESGYSWWLQRIKKNFELFDLLRLDHFRAFAAYWAVPAGEETAVKGTWQPGPGEAIFKAFEAAFGKLPFVAEDLGDIDDAVYKLRDEFEMPGMKVLQFAFGAGTGNSPYIPHNYTPNHLVYTGTHDNNTTCGWYRQDADKTTRRQLQSYSGIKVNESNVAKVLMRLAYQSVAQIAIVPVQDIFQLDESARMNTPASATGNWAWRIDADLLAQFPVKRLRRLVRLTNR